MNKLASMLILLILIGYSKNSDAQNKALTLEDIYTNNLYAQRGIGPLRWMKDNKGYSTLEYNPMLKGYDIVLNDVEKDIKKVLVSAVQLTPKGKSTPLEIADYIWSDDNCKLLIFTNTRKVWRLNTKGDYWVLNLATNVLKQIGKGMEEATLMFAKFSPD
jgi:dipeptidyl-peptidase-4